MKLTSSNLSAVAIDNWFEKRKSQLSFEICSILKAEKESDKKL